jgi:hypothetical protein
VENQIVESNSNELATLMEKALMHGDLSKLSSTERLQYYDKVCNSLGLNPYTRPFDYINLNGKLTLYARRDAAEQLRKIYGVSIKITDRKLMEGLYVVSAMATDKHGRTDESIGAVSIVNLKGNDLANALMKAETKAKRRVTLSIAGMGWLDETETETVPGAKLVQVNQETGEIEEEPPFEVAEDSSSQHTEGKTSVNETGKLGVLSQNQIKRYYCIVSKSGASSFIAASIAYLKLHSKGGVADDCSFVWSKVSREDYQLLCDLYQKGKWIGLWKAMFDQNIKRSNASLEIADIIIDHVFQGKGGFRNEDGSIIWAKVPEEDTKTLWNLFKGNDWEAYYAQLMNESQAMDLADVS